KLIQGDAQFFRCSLKESLASGGPSKGEILLIEISWMGLGARGRALVRSERRVALDEFYAIERHAKLFSDQLYLHGVQPLAQFALAGVSGHAAVRGDSYPGVELIAARTIKMLKRPRSS